MEVKAPAAIRRRNAVRTKASILEAAKVVFAACGYADANLRDIASKADCNVSLVARYFGSKEALFEAALTDAVSLVEFLNTPRDRFGEHVRQLLTNPSQSSVSASMITIASADAVVRDFVMKILETRVIDVLSAWLGEPEARVRATQITIVCTGFTTYRRVLPLPETADPAIGDWLAKVLQDIADG